MHTEVLAAPELYCPISPRISPFAEELDADIAGWMAASGLYERPEQLIRFSGSGFGSLAARLCPDADRARLGLFARWLAFGIFYDDEFFGRGGGTGRSGDAAEAVMAAVSVFLPGGLPHALPRWGDGRRHRMNVALELLAQTENIARPEQFTRFCTQMTLWFYSSLYEPVLHAVGEAPTLAGYTANRHYNIAATPYMSLAEIVTGCEISAEELADQDVRRLTGLTAYETAWCNDIHSAAREISAAEALVGDSGENLPSLLRARMSLDPQEAIEEAVYIHDETMASFLLLERTLRDGASAGLLGYLHMLRTWMRGHYDWCHGTPCPFLSARDA